MERETFIDTANSGWWLLADDLDYQLEQPRLDLGEAFGWPDRDWHTREQNLLDIWTFIDQTRFETIRELDEADDLDKRKAWIAALIALKAPPEDEAAANGAAHAEAPADAPAPPTRLEAAKSQPAPAAPKKSVFAKKQADGVAAGAPGSAPSVADSEAAPSVADGEASSTAEARPQAPEAPVKKSLFARKQQADRGASRPDGDAAPVMDPAAFHQEITSFANNSPEVDDVDPKEFEELFKDPNVHQRLADAADWLNEQLAGATAR